MPARPPGTGSVLRTTLPMALLAGVVGFESGARAQDPPNQNSSVGTGLAEVRDYAAEYSFVDAFKSSHAWFTTCTPFVTPRCTDLNSHETGEEALLDLDPDGWVRSLPGPSAATIFRSAGTVLLDGFGHYPQGQYIVLYDGEGTIEYSYDATRDPVLSAAGRDVLNVTPSMLGIWLNILATDPNQTGNYIRNIRVIMPGFEQTYATQIFHPDFLSKIERYKALRFLDWMVNDASTQRAWANRPMLSEARWSTGRGVPLERMVQLANRVSADPWFTMPHMADDLYVRQFATTVLASLDPRRTVYVEYGNEVWNTVPPFSVAGDWIERQGIAMWPDPTIDPMIKRLNWYGMRAAQICDIWRDVFRGLDSARLNCVISGSVASSITQTQSLDCPLWTAGAPCSGHGIRSLAIGAYCTLDASNPPTNRATIRSWLSDADGGLTRLFNELNFGGLLPGNPPGGELTDLFGRLDASAAVAAARGVTLVAYEGGQALIDREQQEPGIINLFSAANRDPRMGALYDQLLAGFRARTDGIFNHLSNVSIYGPAGAWGALEFQDLLGSPKYDALMRFTQWNPRPVLASISPASAIADGSTAMLTVTGSGFVRSSQVTLNGATLVTAYLSPRSLLATIPGSLLSIGGTYNVTVTTPLPGGGTTAALPFTAMNPVPAPSALLPPGTIVGGPAFTLTINGAGFVSSSQVTFNGSPLVTSYRSSTQLTGDVPASFVSAVGAYNVIVTNPAPGGGSSGAQSFAVSYPAPVLASLNPVSAPAGGPDFTLTLTGSAFSDTSQVRFNGATVASTFVSATQLNAAIPASAIALGGTFNVTVSTPAPGGGTSTQPFPVMNPQPVLMGISPLVIETGSPAFTITASGLYFVQSSRVTFNGAPVATTFVSDTQLTASIPSSFIAVNGFYDVSVTTPAPGGGATGAYTFTVTNPYPFVGSISPTPVIVGGPAFTLTLNGANFVNGSQGTFNGAVLTTTFISANQLSAAVPASFISATGSYDVSVVSSAPGGGTAVPQSITVQNPVPSLVSIFPTSAILNGSSLVITLNGTGFVSASRVTLNGATLPATLVSGTQLTATVPASALTTVGAYDVVVANGTPGGGSSGARPFTVLNALPVLASISPQTVGMGGPDLPITVVGSSFIPDSQVALNGTPLFTGFTSPTLLTATIPAALIANAGLYNITVTSPAPGGGTTTPRVLTVTNPAPALTAITPAGGMAGGPAFTMTLDGSSFVSSSQVGFNNTSVSTTFVSGTQLVAFIPASAIAIGGLYNVNVTNSAPGGGASTRVFTVSNPLPVLASVSPLSAFAGGAPFSLTLSGTSFVPGAVATFNGANLQTTFVSATQLLANVPTSFISATGSYAVTVVNPTPGGGQSGQQVVTVYNPVPVLASISPSRAAPGGAGFTLTLNGSSFVNGSQANFNGPAVATTFVSSTQLLAAIPASAVATAGTYGVSVTNVPPGGGTSEVQPFTANNPVPVLASLSPAGAPAGGPVFTLTVNGASFVGASVVTFNGASLSTALVSPTQLIADVPAWALAVAGVSSVSVTNPAPGGGTSSTQPFTVNNPAPVITGLSRVAALAGDAGFTLTITGSSFVNGSQATFNGMNVATTFSSATQLLAAIPSSAIGVAGSFGVAVTNAAPGGGTSAASAFAVSNPVPALAAITPLSAAAGDPAFTLTLSGDSFVAGAVATFNGTNLATTLVSSAQLLATVPAASIAASGNFSVTVVNPTPGGGASAARTISVSYRAPVLNAISPSSGSPGDPGFTMTVSGSSFTNASQVSFGGARVTTTFVSSTLLQAAIPASAIVSAGSYVVTVTNPPPFGGTSAVQVFSVSNAVPAITSLLPASIVAGGSGFTLTVAGTSFAGGARVTLNGAAVATAFVSATQLTADIPASAITAAGISNVVVTNPSPGGGASNTLAFPINNPAPVISTLSRTSALAGDPAFTLTIGGTSFVNGSQATFNGMNVATTFSSATQLMAAIPASAIAVAGTYSIGVNNSAPGGGASPTQAFAVTNPVPYITGLSPMSGPMRGPDLTVTVSGSSFLSGAQVTFGRTPVTSTFVSSTQLLVAVPASLIALAGNYEIVVTNPGPGGGAGGSTTFAVTADGPVITSLSPPNVTAGGPALTLTVNGSSFQNGATATFNGGDVPLTFVSAAQVTVQLTAASVALGSTFNITVGNPAPDYGMAAAAFTISNALPVLSSIAPASAIAGGQDLTLTLNGSAFAYSAQVSFNGQSVASTFVSPTQLTATIPSAFIASSGSFNVTVTNPPPGGGTSSTQSLTVTNPVPVLSAISPLSAIAGAPAFTLTLMGSSFVGGAQAALNGVNLMTSFSSSTLLTAVVPASLVAAAGALSVTVTNPAPNGGTSAALSFTVTNPGPTISTLSPFSVALGGPAFTLTVNGWSFASGSQVSFNGTNLVTTYVSSTQLSALVPAALTAAAGSYNVLVTSPAPGGGTSAALSFAVTAPGPVIASLSPSSVTAGSAALTLTINGSAFAAGAQVQFNGVAALTTFVSPVQLTAFVPVASIAAAGIFNVTVSNPAPASGLAVIAFSVQNAVPVLTSIAPATGTAGANDFTMTLSGSNFTAGSQASFNGAGVATTYVSPAQLTATVPAALIASSGTFGVTVTTPGPGGGTTAARSFNVVNPTALFTAMTPASVNAGAPAFTLTLLGSSFANGAQATFSGSGLTTTYLSSTELLASVPAAAVATAGAFNVAVTNPSPGGGTSPPLTFTVSNPGPVVSSLSPSTVNAGSPAFTLTVNGWTFVSGSQVYFNGVTVPTTYVSATQLSAGIPAPLVAVSGTYDVTVMNRDPGGGWSPTFSFAVTNPGPVINAVSPVSATAGGAAFTLTVNGSLFVNGAVVSFNGSALPTTFVSSAQLTATVPASALLYPGNFNVTVFNPLPGGGLAAAAFIVNNPPPILSSVSPAGATAGGPDLTITLNGSSFAPTSQATFDGGGLATTFVSPAQLTATVPGGFLVWAGPFAITVTTPSPGGGTSAAQVFTVQSPLPVVTAISPASGVAGGPGFTLTVSGSSFVNGAQASFGGVALATTLVSQRQLTALVPASLITVGGSFNVAVANIAPGGGASAPLTFTLNNPVPVLASISPPSTVAGSGSLAITLNGTSFVNSSQAAFNGAPMPTSFVSSTQLTATIPAASVATAGTFNVTVGTPAPNGGVSAAQTFTANNPVPVLASVAPLSMPAGSPGFTLTLSGSAFVNGTLATFNGLSVPTTFVSSTQLTAAIPASAITVPGPVSVTVANGAPGGGSSASVGFTVSNPVPVLTEIFPASASAGGAAFTLTLTGSAFVRGSQASFAGAVVTTTYVSPTQLTASIPASAVATAGNSSVTVISPAPGGGVSAAQTFTANNLLPVLSGLSPSGAISGGGAFTLTLTGSSFVSGTQATFNGASVATTFVSSAQLTAAIPAAAIATAGAYGVRVANPAPGGGASAPVSFAVNNAVPVLTAISPVSTSLGAPAFTMTLSGSAFIASSQVRLNGSNMVTTFVSPAQLTAAIPSSAIPTAGAYSVVVANPTPGGGSSAQQSFMALNPVPVLSSLSPARATAGDPSFTVTLTGSSFVSGAQVSLDGVTTPATFVSSAQLTAAVPSSVLQNGGTKYVIVNNPGPGGGASAAQPLVVNNRLPVLTSLSPTGASVGSAAFTLAVNGSFFLTGAAVSFNGSNCATSFVSSSQLLATIPASFVSASGTYNVGVVNPDHGASATLPFRVDNPLPALSALSPARAVSGGPGFQLTLSGSSFVSRAVVTFNGANLATTFVSPSQLTAMVPASFISATGLYNVAVVNPAPGGGTSAPQTFTVANPTPVLSSLSPSSTLIGGPAFTLTINGTSFTSGSQAAFNGANVATTFVSSTQVTAAIPGSALAAAGVFNVTLTSPNPGGTSAPLVFTVNNPLPSLASLIPSGVLVGGPAFTLTLTGGSFVSRAQAMFNGAGVATTFVSASQLTAAIPAAAIATAGVFNVTVTNPAPGGGASPAQSFTVSNPAPALSGINPSSTLVGGPAFTLTLNGTSFVGGSQASLNGAALVTTYLSPTQLTAAVPASFIAATGTYPVRVVSPGPGGGTTAAQSFVVNNPLPVLTSISPAVAITGGPAFTLTLNGGSFVSGSQATVNGVNVTTTFVSPAQLTASVPASFISAAGNYSVTVTSPAPGGGTSAAQTLAVNNPVPMLSAISPPSAVAGGAAFTLTLTGSSFINGSSVSFNGAPVVTSFVSSTQLLAAIPATSIAVAGVFNVAVATAAPGGGTSAAQAFTVNNPAPALASISPASAMAGGASFALTLSGSSFVNGTQVSFNGANVPATFVSATQVTAAIPATAISTAGVFAVTAGNPAPGGGVSAQRSFTVNNPVPVLSAIAPASTLVGGPAFTLTLSGSSFVAGSQVTFNGANVPTSFVSGSQLTAAIPASAIATAGAFNVVVMSPGPGGGSSTPLSFTAVNPVPVLSAIAPATATVGDPAFTMTLSGSSFVNGAQVSFNGSPMATSFVSSTRITAAIPVSAFPSGGRVPVAVTHPGPGGGSSAAQTFVVINRLPVLSALSPAGALAGGPAFTLTVNGSYFMNGSSVTFNGASVATTFQSGGQLVAAIPASFVSVSGVYNVAVVNQDGGASRSPIAFRVDNPVPALSGLSPARTLVGGPGFQLTLNGASFVNGAVATFNGANLTTTLVTPSQLTAFVPASFITAIGVYNVTVVNPAPAGGASGPQAFTVANPTPLLSAISPQSALAGSLAFTLTLNGSLFVSGAQATLNGASLVTTFVSATQLLATVPASSIAATGGYAIAAVNPAPGGGASNASTLSISNPVPVLSSISPAGGTAGGPGLTITLNGSAFVSGSQASFGGTSVATTFVSGTQLTAAIPAAAIAIGGTSNVVVTNATPGGGASAAQPFTASNPVPALASLSPASAIVGGPAFTLTLNGSSFVGVSRVTVNGASVATTFVSGTQLLAAIPASSIAAVGGSSVMVTSPAPGGGSSSALAFAINNPVPVISSLSRVSATAGDPAFTLIINGSSFIGGSQVTFNGANVATSFASPTQLLAAVPASAIAVAGSFNVAVTNPAPGGGAGAAQAFSVSNPVPQLTGLSPSSAPMGGPDFTLTLNGSAFVNGAQVSFGSVNLATTFVSTTQLLAVVPALQIASAGNFEIVVTNPAPGGGATVALSFASTALGPVITSLSPSSAIAGGPAVPLTVIGSNFLNGSTIAFNGADLPTSFVSPTQLTATIPAQPILLAGVFNVTVSNPGPDYGMAAATFTAANLVPVLSSISPASATVGSADFVLTLNGSSFIYGSSVTFNGQSANTTFISSTQLTALIPTALVTSAGIVNVSVTTLPPGGGTTAARGFTISNFGALLGGLSPASVTAGAAAFTLTLTGASFVAGAQASFNGVNVPTTFVSSSQLTASISAAAVATAGRFSVTVTNPFTDGSGTVQTFTVNNPVPTISTLSPSAATSGGPGFTLTVTGASLVSGSLVYFNGTALLTTYISSTHLSAVVPSSMIALAGNYDVTVLSSDPGGGTSAPLSFAVTNPGPSIVSLSPGSAMAGGAPFTLTVTGSSFVNGAVVSLNGTDLATSFVSPTQLNAAVTTAALAYGGNFNVTVLNPAPGGGLAAAPFTISNPVPVLTSLSPATATAGGPDLTITLNGSAFVPASQASFDGGGLATTFVSSTQLTATLPAPFLVWTGTFNVTVANPTPGGGTSGAQSFSVTPRP